MELAVTEGRRATDSLELFPCPQQDHVGNYANKFFLHGVRHRPPESLARIANLQPEEQLELEPEPDNPEDTDAVAVFAPIENGRICIGYVPRYLARDVKRLSKGCGLGMVNLEVERLNTDAPLQQRVLCSMHSCWPDGFKPCNDNMYQPIVDVSLPMAA